MKCKKCGADLHPEQKVCLECGTETHLWPGGVRKQEKPPLEIPWKRVGYIGGGAVALIVLIAVILALRVTPPDQVTRLWLEAVTDRKIKVAQQYTTEEFERLGYDQSMSERKSDEFYQFMYDNKPVNYAASPPSYDSPEHPMHAAVAVTFDGANGQRLTATVYLIRKKEGWKINQCL